MGCGSGRLVILTICIELVAKQKAATMLKVHHLPESLGDRFAYRATRVLRFLADSLFVGRYGHRAVVLETIAAVPGMVGGMLRHMRSLRRLESDKGRIRVLLDEAQNERMHLMIFLEIAKPTWFERWLILLAQGAFFIAYLLLYMISARTAHRLIGYFEEEAVTSYTDYLAEIDNGKLANSQAPRIATEYYQLPAKAKLKDVITSVRADEIRHRDANHDIADELT
jgi:ubiquinol oxidase